MTERRAPTWLPTVATGAALATLVVYSFVQRWNVLSSSPFPLGVDGYFYPVQLRSLLETGSLQYPASPLSFYLLAPFAAATDPITGAKLGAAVLGALIALPAYGVGSMLGRDADDPGRGSGLVAAAIATTSAGSMYMTIEFVKNGIGLTVALTALWLVLRALRGPTRRAVIAAIAGIVAAVLTHKMAAGIVIGIAIPAAIAEAHRRGKLRWRKAVPIAIGAGLLGVFVLIGMIMPERFLSPTDLALLDSTFTSDADWSLPVLANKLRMANEPVYCAFAAIAAAVLLVIERGTRRGQLMLIAVVVQTTGALVLVATAIVRGGSIAGVIAVTAIVVIAGGVFLARYASKLPGASLHTREGAGTEVAAWCVIALAMLVALPWLDATSGQGLAMRLRVIAFVPLALCAAIVVRIGARYAARIRLPRVTIGATVAAVVVLLRIASGPSKEGQVITHPALISSCAAMVGRIPEGGVAIVQERHIAYMVAWYARARISMRPEPIAEDNRYRVMPLAFIKLGSNLDVELLEAREHPELPRVIGLHPLHPNGMVIVPEATWKAILEKLPGPERVRLESWPTI